MTSDTNNENAAPLGHADFGSAIANGWKPLGSGASKTAMLSPDRGYVTLCLAVDRRIEANVFTDWVAFCKKNAPKSPHIMRMLSDVSYGRSDTGKDLVMVQCELLKDDSVASWLEPLEILYQLSPSTRRALRSWPDLIDAVNEEADYVPKACKAMLAELNAPKHVALASAILAVTRATPKYAALDFSPGNILRRGNTLVISDPWSA